LTILVVFEICRDHDWKLKGGHARCTALLGGVRLDNDFKPERRELGHDVLRIVSWVRGLRARHIQLPVCSEFDLPILTAALTERYAQSFNDACTFADVSH
jgi:hypothetical protein